MGDATVEHHELLAEGGGRVAEFSETGAGRLAEDAEEMGGRGGGGHAHGAVETGVVIDDFGDRFGAVFHDFLVGLLLHGGHFAGFDFLVGFLPHGFELGLFVSRENGIEIELQRGFEVVAVTAFHRLGHHGLRGGGGVFGHRVFAGGDPDVPSGVPCCWHRRATCGPEVAGDDDGVVKDLADHAAGGGGGEIFLAVLADGEGDVGGEWRTAVGVRAG